MTYKLEVLKCPNCAAPLEIKPNDTVTFCLYCDSSIRINKTDGSGELNVVHSEVPKEIIEEVKKLILSGDKAKAAELYQSAADVSIDEALKQIDILVTNITTKIILNRPLSGKGKIISTSFFLILISSIYTLFFVKPESTVVRIVFWVLMAFMSLNLLSISKSIFLTFKYSSRKWQNAKILKFYFISQKKKLSFFKLFLEVSEQSGITFKTETYIMIKTVDREKIQEGKIISVKYFPDEKSNVVASIKNLIE